MVEFRRIYGDRATLFGAIFAPLSRPNKLPLEPCLPDPRLCPHLCRSIQLQTLEARELHICLSQQRLDPLEVHDTCGVYLGFESHTPRVYE